MSVRLQMRQVPKFITNKERCRLPLSTFKNEVAGCPRFFIDGRTPIPDANFNQSNDRLRAQHPEDAAIMNKGQCACSECRV